jgi:hypothetical protein
VLYIGRAKKYYYGTACVHVFKGAFSPPDVLDDYRVLLSPTSDGLGKGSNTITGVARVKMIIGGESNSNTMCATAVQLRVSAYIRRTNLGRSPFACCIILTAGLAIVTTAM